MAQILAKKAEIQAMLAARKAGLAPPAPGAAAKPAPTPAPPPPAAGGGAVDPTSIAAMLAAAKARLAARVANLGAAAPAPAATTPSSARPGALVGVKKERNDDMPKGGLNLGIHPSLLEPAASASAAGSSKDKGRTMAPKFTSLKVRPLLPPPSSGSATRGLASCRTDVRAPSLFPSPGQRAQCQRLARAVQLWRRCRCRPVVVGRDGQPVPGRGRGRAGRDLWPDA